MLNKHDGQAERCRRRIILLLLHVQDGGGASLWKRNKYSSPSTFSYARVVSLENLSPSISIRAEGKFHYVKQT